MGRGEGFSRSSFRRPSRRFARLLGVAAGMVMLLLGVALVLYPVFSAAEAQRTADGALANWRESVTVSDAEVEGEQYRQKEGDATYEQLLAYNERVRAGEAEPTSDPFAFEGIDLEELGLPGGIIGSVTVERFGETIPLYLGASLENLEAGAGVLAGSSMPTGGEGNNCVIAAHRSPHAGLTLFRDVETLVEGDRVVVETPWDTLVYRVTGHQIIRPYEVDALDAEPDCDMLTLLTCHPYTYNTYRYLVYCERVDEGPDAVERPSAATTVVHAIWPGWSQESPVLNAEVVLRLVGLVLAVGVGLWLVVDGVRRRAHGDGAHFG